MAICLHNVHNCLRDIAYTYLLCANRHYNLNEFCFIPSFKTKKQQKRINKPFYLFLIRYKSIKEKAFSLFETF